MVPVAWPTPRLVVPDLIKTQLAGTPNVSPLPTQQLPDVVARMKEGVEVGQKLLQSKQIAAQSAAQAAWAENAKQAADQYKSYNKFLDGYKNPQTGQPLTEEQKMIYRDMYSAVHQYSFGPQGTTYQPGTYATPMLDEMRKRILSGSSTGMDMSQISGYYPPMYPPQNVPQPAPIKKNEVAPVKKAPLQNQDGGDEGIKVFGNPLGHTSIDGIQGTGNLAMNYPSLYQTDLEGGNLAPAPFA